MRKVLTMILAAAVGTGMLFPFAGCGGTENQLTIEFQFYGSQEEMAATRELVEEYNATNTDGITVEATGTATARWTRRLCM